MATAVDPVLSPNAQIAAWERKARWPLVMAALAPFLSRLLPDPSYGINLAVDLASWAVFAGDLAVHLRISRVYWRSWRGMFDVLVVVLTFPWYVIPGVGGTAFMAIFRWARVARLVFAGETGRRVTAALRRLGALGIILSLTSVLAALIVLRHEPAESGYETFGDALWWSVVSFTTVGYGDLYPVTTAGRVAGGMMMFMGLVALGTVSAVLASTFVESRMDGDAAEETRTLDRLLDEIQQLRAQVGGLTEQLHGEDAHSAAAGSSHDRSPSGPGRHQEPGSEQGTAPGTD